MKNFSYLITALLLSALMTNAYAVPMPGKMPGKAVVGGPAKSGHAAGGKTFIRNRHAISR